MKHVNALLLRGLWVTALSYVVFIATCQECVLSCFTLMMCCNWVVPLLRVICFYLSTVYDLLIFLYLQYYEMSYGLNVEMHKQV